MVGKNNVWTKLAVRHEKASPTATLDWEELEGLFCLAIPQAAPAGGKAATANPGEDSKPQNSQVYIIFLKVNDMIDIPTKFFIMNHYHIQSRGVLDVLQYISFIQVTVK